MKKVVFYNQADEEMDPVFTDYFDEHSLICIEEYGQRCVDLVSAIKRYEIKEMNHGREVRTEGT